MSLIDALRQLDQELFFLINHQLSHPVMDQIMVFVSGKVFWFALALLWLGWMIRQKHWHNVKKGLLVAASLGVADLIAYNLLKPFFGRPRPCKVLDDVNIVDGCGGFFSFPSNHATNAFVVAIMIAFLTRKKRWAIPMYLLACLIGFSRVYLGVHYPGDILAGFIFGSLIGATGLFVGKSLSLR